MINRRSLWKYCKRLVAQFNHAVYNTLEDNSEWVPLELAPFIETDGNDGFGVMANIDASSVTDSDIFKGSACCIGDTVSLLTTNQPTNQSQPTNNSKKKNKENTHTP